MRRAVVLLSGGLDSGTALAMWLERREAVALCLFADYGQRALLAEHRASAALAARFSLPWQSIELPFLRDAAAAAGSALIAGIGSLPRRTVADPGDAASARAVWVPARNVVLVAVAAACAEAAGAEVVLAGFNREEAATFPDNSAEFCAAMTGALALGTRNGVRLESPTQELDKVGIAGQARRLGLARSDFWSCYEDRASPCETCESCVRSRRAFGA